MDNSLFAVQKKIDDILQDYEKPYWDPLSNVAHLAEEVGEVARIINHRYGDKPKKANEKEDDLEDELADLLWSLICIANQEGVNLDKGIQRAIDKLLIRDKDRFKKKSEAI
ncbi:MAG: nucleotide pyrophosphohydrolase [bacterium]|nr:nucleotide pyrophosphohydrolase [bacterium]